MGYSAYQKVDRIVSKDRKKDKPFWPLIMEDNTYATVENVFHVSGLVGYDDETPDSLLSEEMRELNESVDPGQSDVVWDFDQIDQLVTDIKKNYPDHEDTEWIVKKLVACKKRAKNDGYVTLIFF